MLNHVLEHKNSDYQVGKGSIENVRYLLISWKVSHEVVKYLPAFSKVFQRFV